MIQVQTQIVIKDNSGFLRGKCINSMTPAATAAKVGNAIKVSITKAKAKATAGTAMRKGPGKQQAHSSKGSLQTLLIIQTKKPIIRYDGSTVKFNCNSGVSVGLNPGSNKQRLQFGFKRINSTVPFELKNKVHWQAFGGTLNLIKLAKSLV